VRTVWRKVDFDVSVYVPRCSKCGKYKQNLREHWFFSGVYCYACIHDILYDNARNVMEINNEVVSSSDL